MTQVFISYSRHDLSFVERLAKDLDAAGLEVWYDLAGLEVGTRWGREIQDAIDASQYFLVVLSPESAKSQWVEKEFMYADSLKLKIIPLIYQPCKIPMWFINLHLIDVQAANYEHNFPVILKTMGMKADGVRAPVGKAASSVSEAEAQQRQAALKETQEKEERLAAEKTAAEKARQEQARIEKAEADQQSRATQRQKRKTFLTRYGRVGLVTLLVLLVGLGVIVLGIAVGPRLLARLSQNLSPTLTASPAATLIAIPSMISTAKPAATLTSTQAATPVTYVRPKDGMTMVFVPQGAFIMGAPAGTGDPDESPTHTVTLHAFWIDRTEVTNAMYAKCVQAGACQPPDGVGANADRPSYYGNGLFANYPVIQVTWSDADKYCQWAGARLPTEAEWEKAARGTDGRIYPWGNGLPTGNLVYADKTIGDTSPVGSFPDGASPYGALDMAGNVWEWVADWYDKDYYFLPPASDPQGPSSGTERVMRGGAYLNNIELSTTTNRNSLAPNQSGIAIGFRCALTK